MVIRENLPSTLGNEVRIELGRSCTRGNLGKERFTQLWNVTLGLTPATEQQRKKKGKAYMNKQTGRQSLRRTRKFCILA